MMLKLEMKILVEQEDLLEDFCWQWGALAVYRKPLERERAKEIRQVGALFKGIDVSEFSDQAFSFFPDQTLVSIQTEEVIEEAWQESWRKNFQAFTVSGFKIAPEWDGLEPAADTLLVYPGQAFGTGQHETTKLMLKAILRQDLTGKAVLDAGCGTGILAIATEKRGAKKVFGFDCDPDCYENMQHHLTINHTENTSLEIGLWDDLTLGTYDVVLMNITINILEELWPKVASVLKPGGLLITSGILQEQAEQAEKSLKSLGFSILGHDRLDEWCQFTCALDKV